MKAKIYISYKDGILDPQGKTIGHALDSIGIKKINSVRMGKYIEMEFKLNQKLYDFDKCNVLFGSKYTMIIRKIHRPFSFDDFIRFTNSEIDEWSSIEKH